MKRQNFTLTELLVVISIIAILAGIMLPALNRSRTSALGTACSSNLKQVGGVFTLFANDNDDALPPADFKALATPGNTATELLKDEAHIPWYAGLAKRKYLDKSPFSKENQMTKTFVNCPLLSGAPGKYNAYGVPVGNKNVGTEISNNAGIFKRKRIEMDGSYALAADSAYKKDVKQEAYFLSEIVDGTNDNKVDGEIAFRHMVRANVLMLDGRVENLDTAKATRILTYKDGESGKERYVFQEEE